MVGASLAARRAEPTSCQHPFPSCGFDPFAKPQGNDRNSRDADGRSRREAVVLDRTCGPDGWRRAGLTRLISARRNQLILPSIRGADFLKNQTTRAAYLSKGF